MLIYFLFLVHRVVVEVVVLLKDLAVLLKGHLEGQGQGVEVEGKVFFTTCF